MTEGSPESRAVVLFGLFAIVTGVLANEWTLCFLFSTDGILEPSTRARIGLLNIFLITGGGLAIRYRQMIPSGRKRFVSFLGAGVRTVGAFFKPRLPALAFVTFLMALFLMGEVLLRITGIGATWSERLGQPYISLYKQANRTPWIWDYPPNSTYTFDHQPAFTHQVRINAEGVRDIDHPVEKPSDEYRIIGLGDSFTMGVGVERLEDTYLKVLGRRLNETSRDRKIRILSGGVGGSDPVFSYSLFTRRLQKYQPDLVLLTINRSDMDDIIVRGGMDRFGPDGFMKERTPPITEWPFAHSRIIRTVLMSLFQVDYLLLRPEQRTQKEAMAVSVILEVAWAMKTLGEEQGFAFLLVIHPFWPDIVNPGAPNPFEDLESRCAQMRIPCINLTSFFRKEIRADRVFEYFWPVESHCNEKGYDVFARAIEKGIRQIYVGSAFPWNR